MHDIKLNDKFDAIFASNVLEHSLAPYLALKHWRNILKEKGILVLVMPSKEWLKEYYHFSVLTHSQVKDLLYKVGFTLLAGPEMKNTTPLPPGADIFYDLGRGWGHYDGYLAVRSDVSNNQYRLKIPAQPANQNFLKSQLRKMVKTPFNKVRVFLTRRHKE